MLMKVKLAWTSRLREHIAPQTSLACELLVTGLLQNSLGHTVGHRLWSPPEQGGGRGLTAGNSSTMRLGDSEDV